MWQTVDQLGKTLFGRSLRLRALVWVHGQTEPFFQAQAAKGVEYNSATAVAAELDRMCELEMVRSFDRPQNNGRLYYQRIDSPLWEIVAAAERALAEDSGGQSSAQ